VEGQAALSRIRDSRVLDEYVEAAKLRADALRRGGDRRPIRHVELERDGAGPNPLGRDLAALEIARPDQHSESVRRELLCDLKTDSLIRPGDQGDAFVVHAILPRTSIVDGFTGPYVFKNAFERWADAARARHFAVHVGAAVAALQEATAGMAPPALGCRTLLGRTAT
jgi:hypothetical protein